MLNFLESLKLTPGYEIFKPLIFWLELYLWNKRRRSPPTPQAVKHKVVRDIAKKYNISTLVETGTYLGNMIAANKNNFDRIYSIELDSKLFARARRKFAEFKNIKVIKGDSSKVLPLVLKRINKPSIFWLDAHYSGKITAKGTFDTPIISELKSIISVKPKRQIILIDDADYFKGENGYPTITSLKNFISKEYPNYKFEIKYNIIFMYPHKIERLFLIKRQVTS